VEPDCDDAISRRHGWEWWKCSRGGCLGIKDGRRRDGGGGTVYVLDENRNAYGKR